MFPVKWGEKEMGPEGPRRRLGDVLVAQVHREFTYQADYLLEDGFLTQEERIAISKAIGAALEAFTSAIPEELKMRRMDYWNRTPMEILEETGGLSFND